MLGDDFKPKKCPKCKLIVLKLLALNDKGTGKKYCRHCKKILMKKKE